MADLMELTELDFDSLDTKPSFGGDNSSFGGGLEFLMNDKVRDAGRSTNMGDDDLNNLESELTALSSSHEPMDFGGESSSGPGIRLSMQDNLGRATLDTESDAKTWDGYGKFNNIPMNPDRPMPSASEPKMSREEAMREKFKYLRKLEDLERKGVTLSKKYSMESNLQEMIGEYETYVEEDAKQSSIKFQGSMLLAFVNGVEFLTGSNNMFDLRMEGWGDQVQMNLGDYDNIFGELHDKYKSKASIAPELKLLFSLGCSAVMTHMSNSLLKSSSMPSADDILRQHPDLMRSFQTAMMDSMAKSSPGFAGFVTGNHQHQPMPPSSASSSSSQRMRPGNNTGMGGGPNSGAFGRPDLNFSQFDDGISLRETSAPSGGASSRAEMKGPSDISDILSGLKTKTINIQSVPSAAAASTNNNSTISYDDLRDMQQGGDTQLPKRSGRKKKSMSNTVSLDI